jgi:hypothetical protein
MPITSQHVTGFVVGLGAAAAGFYFYKMNQKQVDAWLQSQGINIPGSSAGDYDSMTLEELVREKEKLEDLIAEREYAAAEQKKVKPAAKKPRRVAKRARTKAQQPQAATA